MMKRRLFVQRDWRCLVMWGHGWRSSLPLLHIRDFGWDLPGGGITVELLALALASTLALA